MFVYCLGRCPAGVNLTRYAGGSLPGDFPGKRLVTFAALRQRVLATSVLSLDRFAEEAVALVPGYAQQTITVKVECREKTKRPGTRPVARREVDTAETIAVVISHDSEFAGGYLRETPLVGTRLTRSAAVDADTRPWVYAGEMLARTPLCGTYVFERARRVFDARRA